MSMVPHIGAPNTIPKTVSRSPEQAVEQDVQRLAWMRDLAELTGNRTRLNEIDETLAFRRLQLKTASAGPCLFTDVERHAIRASLTGDVATSTLTSRQTCWGRWVNSSASSILSYR